MTRRLEGRAAAVAVIRSVRNEPASIKEIRQALARA